ncbi:membrane protein insertion efficiency factor YidD [Mycobacterium sp.]|uniref:membrane protein insertion efficiency factor YidD n=1 Tax=Mycobacterium sp. TaxID=1785 RepID=UPI003A8849C9
MSVSLPSRRVSARPLRKVGTAATRAVIYLIGLYRHMVSPLRPASCRFVPTCSQYAVEALTEYGMLRGGWLAVLRLGRCGPWNRGGWDPIPERGECGKDTGAADEDRTNCVATQGESEAVV